MPRSACFAVALGIAFSGAGTIARAQPGALYFEKLSIERGLSQSTINCIFQDRKGFMWFGTQDGLNRYDGYGVTVFRNDPLDSTSLDENEVYTIFEDRSGTLWIGTLRGLNRFNGGDESFSRIPFRHPSAGRAIGPSVFAVAQDARGTMWIGASGGLGRYDPRIGAVRPATDDTSMHLPAGTVRSLACDSTGTVWAGIDRRGVVPLDAAGAGRTGLVPLSESPVEEGSASIPVLAFDRAGNLWAGNAVGVYRFDAGARRFHLLHVRAPGVPPPLDLVSAVCEDRQGVFWVSERGNGLFAYDRVTGAVTAYPSDPARPFGIPTMFLTALYCDRAGDLWIGTNGDGVLRLDRSRARFPRYRIDPSLPDGAPINHVNAFCETRAGDIWVGCRNYIGVFSRDLRVSRIYRSERFGAPGLTAYSIRSIVQDRAGTIWIGTGGAGLVAYDRGRFRRYVNGTAGAYERGDNFFFTILEDRTGELWLGCGGGLFRFDRADGTFHPLLDRRTGRPVFSATVWSLFEDRSGRLWVGTGREGVAVLDTKRAVAARYRHDPSRRNSLSNDAVTSVFEDRDGGIWVTTTNGLNALDPATGGFRVYTTRNGLPNNNVYGMLEDRHGDLWMSTNFGLTRFRPARDAFRNYDMQDGLQSNEYNQGAYLRCRDGRMLFGGVNGFNAFRPADIADNALPPPVVITGCRIHGLPAQFDRAVSDIPELTFSHARNSFSFDFVALDYRDPAKNRYAYMLEGYDRDWVQAGGRRSAGYMNLDGGAYVFRVKAANADGVWNDTGASLRVVVIPPPWKTWWAYVAYVLVLATGVYAVIRIRVRRAVALERLRAGIAADLHDEIGSSLTRISLHAELLQRGIEEAQKERYLAQIADTSRDVVRSMSDVVWSIDARNDTAGSLIDRMRDFAAALFSDERCEVVFAVSGLDPKRALAADVRQNVYLIFKEALHNVARHSDARRVEVVIRNDTSGFLMEIANDGAAKPAPPRRSGHGLRNMAMRAERIGGTMETSFDPGGRVILRRKAL